MKDNSINIQEKKHNARLYPIYKMCSWDLLFYYAIAFVFLTQTKGMDVASVMMTDAIYPLFKVLFQLPTLTLIDKMGKRNSLILANICLSICLIIMILSNGIPMVLLAYLVMAFAFAIKSTAETNLLFDSVTTRKGKGMFARLEEIGARNYYFLDGITSVFTGFLFVINGYIPIIVSIGFTVIAAALSTCFKEVYTVQDKDIKSLKIRVQEYAEQLKSAFRFIIKSHRLQAILVFTFFFDGLIYTSYTLREGLLTELGVSAQYFAIIISVLTVISGIAANTQEVIHNKFKNRALTFISVIYILSFILVGVVCLFVKNSIISIILVLGIYAIQYTLQSPYAILNSKYLKSFASADMSMKIATTFELVKSVSSFVIAFMASIMLSYMSPQLSFLTIGIIFSVIMTLVLIWMKGRFGLKPEQYRKEDIEIVEKVN